MTKDTPAVTAPRIAPSSPLLGSVRDNLAYEPGDPKRSDYTEFSRGPIPCSWCRIPHSLAVDCPDSAFA